MPAKSKKQQRLFGMVHACQKYGKCDSPEVKKISSEISNKDAEDFAKTKHDDMPEEVEENLTLKGFKSWLDQNLNENKNRTGLKFGYPDGYYRSQYPPSYSTPTSATAALDLEIEELALMGTETPNGVPKIIKKPKGMISFPESFDFKNWLYRRIDKQFESKGENMSECKCDCNSCKSGDCSACTCKKCKCDGCTCC
jgi:hypothetical protein